MFDKLLAKENNIDTSGFSLKTKYDIDKSDYKQKNRKIYYISGFVKKTDYNAKITEIGNKIPSVNSLATTDALTVVKNKILDVRNLVKKTDYDAKILDIESK